MHSIDLGQFVYYPQFRYFSFFATLSHVAQADLELTSQSRINYLELLIILPPQLLEL